MLRCFSSAPRHHLPPPQRANEPVPPPLTPRWERPSAGGRDGRQAGWPLTPSRGDIGVPVERNDLSKVERTVVGLPLKAKPLSLPFLGLRSRLALNYFAASRRRGGGTRLPLLPLGFLSGTRSFLALFPGILPRVRGGRPRAECGLHLLSKLVKAGRAKVTSFPECVTLVGGDGCRVLYKSEHIAPSLSFSSSSFV